MEAIIRPEFQGNSVIVLSRVSRSGRETACVLLSSVCARVGEGPAIIFLGQAALFPNGFYIKLEVEV